MTEREDEELIGDEGIDGATLRADRRRLGAAAKIAGAVGVTALALAAGVWWGERRAAERAGPVMSGQDGARSASSGPAGSPASRDTVAATPRGSRPAGEAEEALEVTLTAEAIERAGIRTEAVRSRAVASAIAVPGTVAANAYRETRVSALVGGIVRHVSAELGSTVQRGERLAIVFSPELADAQTKYLSMRAMLQADHQKRARTEKLVAIGAASRQELEEVSAVHAAHESEVAAARQRLLLLGLSPEQVVALGDASQVVSEVSVASPAAGVVLARAVNPGQVVSPAQELFVVADLASVWVIGDLYEQDFPAVRVGSEAIVSVPALPRYEARGRVAYIDPRVDPGARTAKVRVEVANPRSELRLGMYVTVTFPGLGTPAVVVPRGAVHAVGDRMVVYVPVAGDETRFTERPVQLGPAAGNDVSVVSGLRPGERIVTDGSFFLRAEAGRTRSGG